MVEGAFGVLKTRWRSIFLKALEVKVDFVQVIVACLFLHNLCIRNGDILEPEVEEEDEDDGVDFQAPVPVQQSGDGLRNRLAAAVSAPDNYVKELPEHDYC